MQFRLSDKALLQTFKKTKASFSVERYEAEGYTIRYVDIGDKDKPLIIFVHGAPGSSQDFKAYLKDSTLLHRFRMIAVDRPGYGYSGFGRACTSIQQQAACLAPLLDLNRNSTPVFLVGHSYGGPVIARLAMDYPEKASGPLLFLAPAIDPDNEKIFWFNSPFARKELNWLLPRAFRVANAEKIAHRQELEQMRPLWNQLNKQPCTFVHGDADWIVSRANSEFGMKLLPQARAYFYPDMDHMMIWNRFELVKTLLLETAPQL